MQQRAGLLFLAKSTGRILLIYQDAKWTIPTFTRHKSVLEDAEDVMNKFSLGKILPIELYLSEDKGFEYGTYVCLTNNEFLTTEIKTIAWSDLEELPKNLHTGLKQTLQSTLIRFKLKTIIEIASSLE